MMSDVRLRVTMMMMCVLSLVLLEAHQALGVEIRVASKVIRVLVNVSVYVAMKVSVNATIHRRRLVMMLIWI